MICGLDYTSLFNNFFVNHPVSLSISQKSYVCMELYVQICNNSGSKSTYLKSANVVYPMCVWQTRKNIDWNNEEGPYQSC